MKQPAQAFDMSESLARPSFALTQFTRDELVEFWPKLEEMLDHVPHTWRHWTKDSIYASIMNDTMQVWGIGPPPNAVLVFFTQINVYPAMKVLSLVWGAGSFDRDMVPLIHATMKNYAKLNECSRIEFFGRKGWESVLTAVGMKREYVVWSMNVPNVRMN